MSLPQFDNYYYCYYFTNKNIVTSICQPLSPHYYQWKIFADNMLTEFSIFILFEKRVTVA